MCHAQYAVLSSRDMKIPLRIEAHIKDACKVDIITSYHVHNRWGYIQIHTILTRIHQYIANTIQKSRIRLRMKHKRKTWTTSTLLAQAADLEPIPRSTKENSKSKRASLSRQIIALPVPASVVVVICEPRGLSNPITMGSKTIKA